MPRTVAKSKTRKRTPQLPAFRDDEEVRRFWDTHSAADYLGQMRPVRVQVSKRLRERAKSRRAR
jgi:hypothetical protein